MSKLIGFIEAENSETNNAFQFIRRSKWTNGSKFQILGRAFMKPVYKDADPKTEKKLNDEAKPSPVLKTTLDLIYVNSRFKSKIDKDDNILTHNGTFDAFFNDLLDRQAVCNMTDAQVLDWLVEHMQGIELTIEVVPYVAKGDYPANWINFHFANPNQRPQLPTPTSQQQPQSAPQQTAPQQPLAAQPQYAPQQSPYQATAVF